MNHIQELYEDDGKSGTHVVMWSGGRDSTLLLYELLEAYGAEHVIAITYNYPWLHQTKAATEKACRDAFKAKMKTLGPKFGDFRHMEMIISNTMVQGSEVHVQNGGLVQAIAWLLSIPMLAVPNNEWYIYAGYIRGDDLLMVKHEYETIFESVKTILRRDIQLRMPYAYVSKAKILESTITNHLYDITWTCETPEEVGTPCLTCHPCRTWISALSELFITTEDPLVRAIVTQELRKIQNKSNRDEKENAIRTVTMEEGH